MVARASVTYDQGSANAEGVRVRGARYYVRLLGSLRRAFREPGPSEPVERSGFGHACEPEVVCHEFAPADVRA
jgi:hypothetical protein